MVTVSVHEDNINNYSTHDMTRLNTRTTRIIPRMA